MRADEFEKIATAIVYTQNYTLDGKQKLVSMQAVLEILISHIHFDDRDKWRFDRETQTLRRVQDENA